MPRSSHSGCSSAAMRCTSCSIVARGGLSGGRGPCRRVSSAACSAHCWVSAALPMSVYIAGRIPDTTAQRATISLMVALNVGLRVAAFAIAGLFTGRDLWLAIGLLLPVAWAGVWTGNRVHMRVAPAKVAQIVGAVLLFSGASLIARAL